MQYSDRKAQQGPEKINKNSINQSERVARKEGCWPIANFVQIYPT